MGLEMGAIMTPGAVNTDLEKLRTELGLLIRKKSSQNAEWIKDKNFGEKTNKFQLC